MADFLNAPHKNADLKVTVVSSATTKPSDKLSISLNLGFCYLTDIIPTDMAYPFDSGHKFGDSVLK